MADILSVLLVVMFFALGWGMVAALEKLKEA
jgi:hypothetical protein